MFVAHLYMLGILLGTMAVWSLNRYRYGYLAAAVLGMITAGIYQAFLLWMGSLMVVYVMFQCLKDHQNKQMIFQSIVKCAVAFFGALAGYLLVNKLLIALGVAQQPNYQGIDQMGSISLGSFPEKSYKPTKRLSVGFCRSSQLCQ